MTLHQERLSRKVALYIALLATAVAFGAALAHALELPNKIALGRESYFLIQSVYSGWDKLAVVLLVQLLAILAVVYLHRQRLVRIAALLALAGLVAAQVIFWLFTYPANAATANWTLAPVNWQQLRVQWEYSHLAGAVCQLVALTAMFVAAISAVPTDREPTAPDG